MTPEQIKQLAKQAGGMPYVNRHFPGKLAVAFSGESLIEFVRLVQQVASHKDSTQSNMNLDDAIDHAQAKAVGVSECHAQHSQLAEWLLELKSQRVVMAQALEVLRNLLADVELAQRGEMHAVALDVYMPDASEAITALEGALK